VFPSHILYLGKLLSTLEKKKLQFGRGERAKIQTKYGPKKINEDEKAFCNVTIFLQ
jgi:hypothetical protein